MNTKRTLAAVALTGALIVGTAACSVDDDHDERAHCSTVFVPMFFSTVDRHYHYGSPTGKVVPAHKVPASARKHSGYKAPAAPKPPVNKTPKGNGKVDTTKPGGSQPKPKTPDAPKANNPAPRPAPAPAPAPAPRVGGRR